MLRTFVDVNKSFKQIKLPKFIVNKSFKQIKLPKFIVNKSFKQIKLPKFIPHVRITFSTTKKTILLALISGALLHDFFYLIQGKIFSDSPTFEMRKAFDVDK